MQCPGCKAPMVVLEVDSVEVDYCTSCRGIWLDGDELALLLEDARNRDALMASLKTHTGGRERRIRCPICRKRLSKVVYGDDRHVLLDLCPGNHGLWFDDGELHEVIDMGDFPDDHHIYEIINNIFGQGSRT